MRWYRNLLQWSAAGTEYPVAFCDNNNFKVFVLIHLFAHGQFSLRFTWLHGTLELRFCSTVSSRWSGHLSHDEKCQISEICHHGLFVKSTVIIQIIPKLFLIIGKDEKENMQILLLTMIYKIIEWYLLIICMLPKSKLCQTVSNFHLSKWCSHSIVAVSCDLPWDLNSQKCIMSFELSNTC